MINSSADDNFVFDRRKAGATVKLTVSREPLFDALQKVTTIIGARSTLPILVNVLLEADGETLALTTTDLEIRIRTEIAAKVGQPGRTTLPAKTLFNVVRELPGEEVSIDAGENHQIRLESGASTYRLNGMATDDFPKPTPVVCLRGITLPQADLARMMSLVSYAASTDDSRKMLNGVHFKIAESAFTTVATDGKRLALVEKMVETRVGDDGEAIIPSKAAAELQRLLGKEGDAVIEIGESQASFQMGRTHMVTKLVEGTYPNYRQVIPTSFSKKIEIAAGTFSAALRRVSLVVSETSPFVKFSLSQNAIELHAESAEKGESKESLAIEYVGQELAISFNPLYLTAPFRVLDADKVHLQINDGFSPVALSAGEGFLYVIMPMRQK
jgi:DNA polymerase-3 subunit beta